MSPSAPPPMPPLAIRAFTATSALGRGLDAHRRALREQRSGLRRNDFGEHRLDCWIGRVDGVEDSPLPPEWAQWECRNNRLAWIALQQDGVLDAVRDAIGRFGAERVAVVIGTSTSSIGATEEAYTRLTNDADGTPNFPEDLRRPIIHTVHSPGDFVQHATGARGPAVTVATACSSSAKVFAQAARLIEAGVADAAIVGGVDTLCGSVIYGFNSLQLVSKNPCKPFDATRDGLSLGEAGGFAVVERAVEGDTGLQLRGYGESSDAHHMSAPHPEGLGAQNAMRDALARGGVDAADIGYLNLHGTATPANDRAESLAIKAVFPDTLHASSTKAYTGHTLGAAGIVESVIALLALESGELPGTLGSSTPDEICGPQIRFDSAHRDIRYAMNNSFGFGGNNCSLLFGRVA
ncbi:3-oxoacyl-[acyl-carrier-protein] synthase-1 [Lysobacter sp. HA18]